MKATGIVRRIEECVIIGQTAPNPHKHWVFHWFAPLNALVSKTGFWAVLERSENHSKYASEIHTLLQPKLNIQTVTLKSRMNNLSHPAFFMQS